MAVQASFAKKTAGPQDCDDGFLALLGNDGKLDPSFLDEKDCVRDVALGENDMPFSIFGYRFSFAHVSEKYFGIERGLGLRAPRPWALGALAHGESSIIRRSRVNRFLRSRRSDRLAALAASMMRPANSSRGCTPWDYGEPAARCLHLLRYGV